MPNKLSRYINNIKKMPHFMHSFLFTKLFCGQVKFANTANIILQTVNNDVVVLTLKNQKKVQNHISGIHAVAAALLAESATGLLLGMNLPDSRLPLLKSMSLEYHRRMQGNLSAKAVLTNNQIQQIKQQEKGELVIDVTLTDNTGKTPIVAKMLWAWINKQKK